MHTEQSETWLDRFPVEIVFEIFDYLSSNDILYTFFHFNYRFNTIILQDHRHLTCMKLPPSNSYFWRTIIFAIRSNIQTLIITHPAVWLPLNIFSNLTSIIIDSETEWSLTHIASLFNLNGFKQIYTLKILNASSINANLILPKIFHPQCTLQRFHCEPIINLYHHSHFNNLQSNLNLRTLTINTNHFKDIYHLIQHAFNLKDLTLRLGTLYTYEREYDFSDLMKIKLEKLSITMEQREERKTDDYSISRIDLVRLVSVIRMFSQSLLFLSLNFTDYHIFTDDNLLSNGEQLQMRLLQYLGQLKNFHLNVNIVNYAISNEPYSILSTFRTEFYFQHHWSFGMNRYYLYSLPFKYDELYGFESIELSNSTLLQQKSTLWDRIRTVRLERTDGTVLNDLIHMSYLQTIKIRKCHFVDSNVLYGGRTETSLVQRDLSNSEGQSCLSDTHLSLHTITSVYLTGGDMENDIGSLLRVLPNLNHLVLKHTLLPSMNSSLVKILQEKIQRLEVIFTLGPAELIETSYMYFSNFRYARFTFNFTFNDSILNLRSKLIEKFLKHIPQLISLTIYLVNPTNLAYNDGFFFTPIIQRLEIADIGQNYTMTHIRNSLSFEKIAQTNRTSIILRKTSNRQVFFITFFIFVYFSLVIIFLLF
ncbi:unnamed protein product [Adineta ricciae]|uniref:F-box domain-containing protein n=1 Tax=Adineta ricciae TaxID=249248 RepID=A0A814PJQ7_ADIRI|nr:unnamed protein product [Adineta ricciae]CAF1106735.1 unnamed protein product [Adineta ricciae]